MDLTENFDDFLKLHRSQLESAAVPNIYWQTLHKKLVNQLFDAGEIVQVVEIQYNEERQPHEPVRALQAIVNIEQDQSKHIYLIDHAWTYRVEEAKKNLLEVDSLRLRLSRMFGFDPSGYRTDELVEKIFNETWRYNNFFTLRKLEGGDEEEVENRLPIWYIMDEVGSAVIPNNAPNCRIVPFVYLKQQITYSLLFPVDNIKESELFYRNFAEGFGDDPVKLDAALLPWIPKSFTHLPIQATIPAPEYYLEGHIEESLPGTSEIKSSTRKDIYKVYTQYALIAEYLTCNRFEIVDNEEQADVLWYVDHFKKYKELSEASPDKLINQFPFEFVLTVKDLLNATCRRYNENQHVHWLPITYNLVTEIGNFLSYFQQRDSDGLENYWIVKPYNLARGLDMHITNNLNYLMRLPATGPKIVQKYITNPVLFYRAECSGKVKFDLRYVILLKSVCPLQVYVYKHFFLRFANKSFALDNFQDYQQHFTVMNYNEAKLKRMLAEEFKLNWMEQYQDYNWDVEEAKILEMIQGILKCAVMEKPPCGIGENPQSRGLYAADIMLEWTGEKEIQPKILEINFTPDCKRACEYYPEFYNDVFQLLFLEEEPNVFFKLS